MRKKLSLEELELQLPKIELKETRFLLGGTDYSSDILQQLFLQIPQTLLILTQKIQIMIQLMMAIMAMMALIQEVMRDQMMGQEAMVVIQVMRDQMIIKTLTVQENITMKKIQTMEMENKVMKEIIMMMMTKEIQMIIAQDQMMLEVTTVVEK